MGDTLVVLDGLLALYMVEMCALAVVGPLFLFRATMNTVERVSGIAELMTVVWALVLVCTAIVLAMSTLVPKDGRRCIYHGSDVDAHRKKTHTYSDAGTQIFRAVEQS